MVLTSLLLSLLVPIAFAQAEPFRDTAGHPQASVIDQLRVRGIVRGYSDGRFLPDVPINRAEYLKVLMLAAKSGVPARAADRCFADFEGDPQWYWNAACAAKDAGIVQGYPDGTFQGGQPVILVEALKMAVVAWDIPLPRYVRAPDRWYQPYVDAVSSTDAFVLFRQDPAHVLTRGDAAALLVALGQPLAVVSTQESSSPSSGSSSSSVALAKEDGSSLNSWYVRPATVHAVCGDGIKEGTEQCDDGNREDGDGCSSLCIIVPEPIHHSAIRIDQRFLGDDTRTGGSSQTVLFSFDAGARWQQAVLTALKFRAVSGSLGAAVNYRLYEDENGDGIPEHPLGVGVVRQDVLSFSGLDSLVHTERGTRYEVRADLLPSSGAALALGFLTDDPAYVEAVGYVDGRELTGIRTDQSGCPSGGNCWIAVYTYPSAAVTVTERGSLFVTRSGVPVRSHQLLMGSATDDLLRVSLRAAEEDIRVTRLAIQGAGGSLAQLELFLPGESAPFAAATASQCRSPASGRLCAAVNLTVPKDVTREIIVRGGVETNFTGAISGETVILTLSAATNGSDPAVEAVGSASQSDLTQNDGDANAEGEIFIGTPSPAANSAIAGPAHDIAAAKFAAVANGSADADGTPVPLGQRAIGTFRFRAAQSAQALRGMHRATLQTLTFDVAATNVRFAAGSFTLSNTLVPTATAPCTETHVTGAFRVTCSALEQSAVNVTFDQGQEQKLALNAYVESSQVVPGGSSVLQVSLGSIADRSTAGSVEWDDGTTTFRWVDMADTAVRSTVYRMP